MNSETPPPVAGFRFAGVAAGLKKREGALDLGAIVADEPVTTAALFTTNIVKAAPVVLAQKRVSAGRARAILANAGCANACTGEPGMKAALNTTAGLARALNCPTGQVLPASTGVIGALLSAERVLGAVPSLVEELRPDGVMDFAEAIRTTDRWPKVSHVAKDGVTVVGVAKGAGMIHPDLATTLAFLVTDASATATVAQRALRLAADETFNAISVDGDTSTNDTLTLMCSGASEAERFTDPKALAALLLPVLDALARSIVADGEGTKHTVTLVVEGARSAEAARAVARTIATSPLVKTALHGRDPNWGRILGAAGRAGVTFDPSQCAIRVGEVPIVAEGVGLGAEAEQAARAVMQGEAYQLTVRLGGGPHRAHYVMCDLGHDYVDVNASYRS